MELYSKVILFLILQILHVYETLPKGVSKLHGITGSIIVVEDAKGKNGARIKSPPP